MISMEEHQKAVQAVMKAEFAARVQDLSALKEVFGVRVEEIVRASRAKRIEVEWRKIAEKHGSNDIQALKDTLWQWVIDEGIEYEMTDTEEGTQFRVTRCPFAEMARELGASEWGFICYCQDDPPLLAGFNPNIGFRRTKTLMQGDDCCDHFFFMKN